MQQPVSPPIDTIGRRAILKGGAALGATLILPGAAPALAAAPPTPGGFWGGINHGTGFFPDDPFLSSCIRAGEALGLKTLRMGMNTVGGASTGSSFTWTRRDNAVRKYIAAGFRIHGAMSFREHVSRPNKAQWESNWRNFVRQVMSRYRAEVPVWIIDNEPELGFGNYLPTPQECVTFTRIAWEELHDLGLEATTRIESPPVKSIESGYLGQMLDAGLANYCHIIGVHCYGSQIEDHRIRTPWDRLAALGIADKAVGISESGIPSRFAPKGFAGGAERWRAIFHRQYRVQAKAFGFEYALMFDLDRWRQREGEWRIAAFDSSGSSFQPVQPVWDAVKDSWGTPRRLTNGDFEGAEDGFGNWMVRHSPDAAAPSEPNFVTFPKDAAKARQGSGYCRMNLAGTDANLVVRQVADGLTPGKTYRVAAWAYLTGGAATLKVVGYDRLNGLAEKAATTSRIGLWTRLTVDVTLSNPWLVVELRSKGTRGPGHELRWDTVWMRPLD